MVLDGEWCQWAVGQKFQGFKIRETVRQAWLKLLLQAVEIPTCQSVFSLGFLIKGGFFYESY
jgi:hypothetical protein